MADESLVSPRASSMGSRTPRRVIVTNREAQMAESSAVYKHTRETRAARSSTFASTLASVRLLHKSTDPRYAIDVAGELGSIARDENRLFSAIPGDFTPPKSKRMGPDMPARLHTQGPSDLPVRHSTSARSPTPAPGVVPRTRPLPTRPEVTGLRLPQSKSSATATPRYMDPTLYAVTDIAQTPRGAVDAKRALRLKAMIIPPKRSVKHHPVQAAEAKPVKTVPKDFVPRVASLLPPDHGVNVVHPQSSPRGFRF